MLRPCTHAVLDLCIRCNPQHPAAHCFPITLLSTDGIATMDEDEWLARDLPVGIDMRGDKTQYLLSCPYEGSVALPLNDKAPVTDEEWAEALKT